MLMGPGGDVVLVLDDTDRDDARRCPTSESRWRRLEKLKGASESLALWTELLSLVTLEFDSGSAYVPTFLQTISDVTYGWTQIHRVNPRRWAPIFAQNPCWEGFALFTDLELGSYQPTDESLGRLASSGRLDEVRRLSLRGCWSLTNDGLEYLSTQTLPLARVLDLRQMRGPTLEAMELLQQRFQRARGVRVLFDQVKQKERGLR